MARLLRMAFRAGGPDTIKASAGVTAGLLALAGAMALALWWAGLLVPLQTNLDDRRFGWVTRPPTGQVLAVEIDEPSIRAVGVWPWSRSVHAAVVTRLQALGATDIAFDVDFSSPSTPEGDAALQAALTQADGAVTLAALQQPGPVPGSPLLQSRPLPRFADHAFEASVNVRPDRDNRIRTYGRGDMFGRDLLPSMGTQLAGLGGDADAAFLIDYGIAAHRLPHVSVADLLAGRVPAAAVRGRKAIVGATAVELRDIFEVPVFGLLPGPLVQVMAAESLLQGRALQRPRPAATALATGLVLLGLALVALRRSFRLTLGACLAGAAAVEGVAAAIQQHWPLLPDTAPIQAALGAAALLVVIREIVERRATLRASRHRTAKLRAILDRVVADNFAGIVVVDREGTVQAASAAAADILGMAPEPGRTHRGSLPPLLSDLIDAAIEQARAGAAGSQPARDVRVLAQGGRPVLLHCVLTASPAETEGTDALAVCLTFQDVTEAREAERRIAEMARTDALTGLSNRFVFMDRAEALLRRSSPGCVTALLFDIDHFRFINDRAGLRAGDALIRAVADRLRALAAPGDTLARLGGDEFALLVERPSEAVAWAFAQTLAEALAGTYELGDHTYGVSLSLGAATLRPGDGPLLGADAARQAAKLAGGGCARLFDAALRQELQDGHALAEDLARALGRGEIEVFYQRQVRVADERIVGVEALARWKHPKHGWVSPARFIPLAERTGLIVPLGAHVLATACRDAARWPVPIKVSVNLSAVQLARADLPALVRSAAEEAGLPAGRLDLELTESMLMSDREQVAATLKVLRASGVTISLDDFGTGYSSLSYLRSLPIDKVKIDQSFIRDLHAPSGAAIVRAVVGLARDLGLRVNAEGVETRGDFDTLVRLGCDEVQGYLHGRPEPTQFIAASLLAQAAADREAQAEARRQAG